MKCIESYRIFSKNGRTKKRKKPLMVVGARQTGKTWEISDFCEKVYGDFVIMNLEKQTDMCSVFEGNLDPDTVIRGIEQMLDRRITENTAIFIDEIQTCERAITSLKYFCEDPRNFRIITAGSLLGVKINRFQSSFPVGKVKIIHLYPMDFEEFLIAIDEEILVEGIKESYTNRKSLVAGVHEKALRLYHDYLLTGGMPETILDYLNKGKNIISLDHTIHENLHLAYLADMTKYVKSPEESVKINETYHSIPRQLANDNPKFRYNEVRKSASKRDFSSSIGWLAASEMILKVDNLIAPSSPLSGYDDRDSFKVYLSDVGLLSSLCGIKYRDLLPDTMNIYKGGIVENYVYQQMKIRHPDLYYYKPSQSMEVDMIFDDGKDIIPVEIKSGRHRRSTSLKNYREKFNPPYAIRISEANFGYSDGLFSVPLYAVFCI